MSAAADPIAAFATAMAKHEIVTAETIVADGELHRFYLAGDRQGSKNGCYILHLDGHPAGWFSCWKRSVDERWKANGAAPDERVDAKIKRQIETERQRRREEEAKRHEEAGETAAGLWGSYQPAPADHPYLVRKGVQAHGARVNERGDLVIPVQDVDGKIQSLQTINANGVKLFMRDGKAGGGMYPLGELGDRIVIAEGFATAAWIHEVTGLGVIAAFNCGNLEPVAKAIREKHSTAQIIVAADNDDQTEGNPGLVKAREAAEAAGGSVAEPGIGGDFNDLFVTEGAAAVAARFNVESEPLSEVQGDFRVEASGVYHQDDRISSRVDVLGVTRDNEGKGWGRYLAVHHPDGGVHHLVVPHAATIGESGDCIKLLVDHGMVPPPSRKAQTLVVEYLHKWATEVRVRSVPRIGWHGETFVLPDQSFGKAAERVVLQSTRPAKFEVSGTLEGWHRNVAALASGNSRLAFCISAAFAGPLLHLIGADSVGFHLRGASSTGKTSLLTAAASVWGLKVGSWRTTDNAAEAMAAATCDTLLTMDELSQVDKGQIAAAMTYMLANGPRAQIPRGARIEQVRSSVGTARAIRRPRPREDHQPGWLPQARVRDLGVLRVPRGVARRAVQGPRCNRNRGGNGRTRVDGARG